MRVHRQPNIGSGSVWNKFFVVAIFVPNKVLGSNPGTGRRWEHGWLA
jgi:hypothetical protein